jgi:hypothetical protein
MNLVISVTDQEIQDQPIVKAFEDKLRLGLSQPVRVVAICLHPELGCNVELLSWLETWHQRFIKVRKQFYIIPGNVNQLECLEVSHPDQGLKYVPSLNDFEVEAESIETQQPVLETPAPVQTAAPASTIEKITETAGDKIDIKEEPSPVPEIEMNVSSRVETSGEYICLGCRRSRMWLKGDISEECDNPECQNAGAGWKLTYELF